MQESLSMEAAVEICSDIQARQPIKLFTQCWGCTTFSKGERSRMCGGVVACNLVLKHYQKQQSQQSRG